MTPSAEAAPRLEDPGAFRAFYRDALPRIYGYFMNRCGNDPAVAEDLTQETFMAAVQALKKGPRVDDPTAWIVGIARHKLVDHYRSREREERKLAAVAASVDLGELVDWEGDEDSHERALEALGNVAGPQRAALVLRYLDGLSVPQVAAQLGKSVHATESLLMRGKQAFRVRYVEASHG
ncbi:MAG: RNA polymerase sigma factor [Actinomycetota bacterium]